MNKKILIIDDDPDTLVLISYLLKAHEFNVFSALGAQEGLNIALKEIPDLILCDMILPGIDGYEFLKQIKTYETLKNIPILAMSAFGFQEDINKAMTAGFNGYISKPLEINELLKIIEPFLGKIEMKHVEVKPPPSSERPLPKKMDSSILLVDNVKSNLEFLQKALELEGYKIATCFSVDEALRILKNTTFDLIMTDLNMPKQSGFDFLEALKSDNSLKNIPVLLLTASILTEQERILAETLGVKKCILRPIDFQNLIAEVESILRKK